MIFHEDVLVDILSRLPTKSIGRFRCVSKPWNALLSNPHFIKTHLNRLKHFPFEEQSIILVSHEPHFLFSTQLKNAHHMFDEMTAVANQLNFDDHYFDSETIVGNMASCDGLILVEDEEYNLLLINPTTKENKELPKSPYALDPLASFTMHGLGYDSITDDYKVVTLSYYDTDNEHEPDCTEMFVNVYSVKNGSWKRGVSSPYDHAVGHVTSGVFLNEHIHWLACRTSDYSSVIVAFDLGQEKFHEVPPPRSLDKQKFVFNHLAMIGGCLCMFASSKGGKTDVWVMKEYGVEESWTKLSIAGKSDYSPLCLLGKEQLVLVKDADTTDEKLVIYNLKEGRFKDVVIEGIPYEFVIAGTSIESLVSPDCSVAGKKVHVARDARKTCNRSQALIEC